MEIDRLHQAKRLENRSKSLTYRMLTAAKLHLGDLMTAIREKDEEARQEVQAKLISEWMALHSSSTPPTS